MVKISSLKLQNFRNFSFQNFQFSGKNILFCGANGTGKTNILEAISLLGRNSFKSTKFAEMVKIFGEENSSKNSGEFLENRGFEISSNFANHPIIDEVHLIFEAAENKKSLLVNGEEINGKNRSDFKNYLPNCILLNPAIEQLFISDKGNRRDYLDKIVSDLDLEHQNRLSSYEKLIRQRINFLQNNYTAQQLQSDSAKQEKLPSLRKESWLKIVENQIVELGAAIAAARIEAVDFFNRAIASFGSNFPKILLQAKGEIEEMICKKSMLEVEEFYQQKLQENRQIDGAEGRTSFGIHRSDFDAVFLPKNLPATICSTGEQKAAMISITLARAKISATYKNQPTILLFDEAASHLDLKRKEEFLEEVFATNLQSFFTATSSDLIPEKFQKELQIIGLTTISSIF